MPVVVFLKVDHAWPVDLVTTVTCSILTQFREFWPLLLTTCCSVLLSSIITLSVYTCTVQQISSQIIKIGDNLCGVLEFRDKLKGLLGLRKWLSDSSSLNSFEDISKNKSSSDLVRAVFSWIVSACLTDPFLSEICENLSDQPLQTDAHKEAVVISRAADLERFFKGCSFVDNGKTVLDSDHIPRKCWETRWLNGPVEFQNSSKFLTIVLVH